VICPYCRVNDDRVIDSRTTDGGNAVRRRRVCNACGKRFTTYERIDTGARMMVVKRDGSRQAFDSARIRLGIQAACAKRPVPAAAIQAIVDEVEETLYREFDREIPSKRIGQAIMDRLRKLDQVAYVRFASVYKEFKDLDDMLEEVKDTKQKADADIPGQADLFTQ